MKTPEQADGLLRKFVQERDRKRRDALKRAATTDGRASPAAGADTANADDGANDAATADSTDADSAEESETAESVLMLCPTCFRALQLIGGFDDGKAVLAGLRDFLQGDLATVRSKRELDRLNKWLPTGN